MTQKTMENVVVQGLGFVGAAMAAAVAAAKDHQGVPFFNVTGLDLDNQSGRSRVEAINSGCFPFETEDAKLSRATEAAVIQGNLRASTDPSVIGSAQVVLISVNLDVSDIQGENPYVDFTSFRMALKSVGEYIQSGTLVIVETTVPPGTCTEVVKPVISKQLELRGMDPETVFIAHSYERVMPGADYLDSIVNFWRVYSGLNDRSADLCRDFLSKVIDVDSYPLTRLDSTAASETAKILENSYRAVNIAFMEEWGRFAEKAGIDLFQVINAIRVRPTHSNMRQPGFGVGGYCLTKDPLLAAIAARDILGINGLSFPFSTMAVKINREMPLVTLGKIRKHFQGSLKGIRILLLGVSYRQEVGDTRHSPAELFTEKAIAEGAVVTPQDPFLDNWEEMSMNVLRELPDPADFDALVFAVPHSSYREIDFGHWLGKINTAAVFDANNVLSPDQIDQITGNGHQLLSIGRGTSCE